MEFLIPELNPYDWKPIFSGPHSRNPTVTDVKFISENRLVAANRQAAKLYLIEKITSGFHILHTLDTIIDGIPYHTDLFDVINNTIYATNFTNTACVYKITESAIVFVKTLTLHATNKYHGAQVFNNCVYFTCSQGISTVAKYTIDTHQITHITPERIGQSRIKDICFVNNCAILLLNSDGPKEFASTYDGEVALYSVKGDTFKFLVKRSFKGVHFDSVTNKSTKIYATAHSEKELGLIYVFDVKDNLLQLLETKPVYGFPHGIDIYGKTLAYTSYNTSGIHFLTI
jgi:hypothetical protein